MEKDLKQKARLLRREGYSFREIGEKVNRSISTVGLWCRQELVTDIGIKRLKKLGDDGRKKGVLTNNLKKNRIIDEIKEKVYSYQNTKYSVHDYKIFLAMLYWGEGAKTGTNLNFTNSDPKLIAVYLKLLRLVFDINEKKFYCHLHLHSYHNKDEMLNFWSNITGIAKSQFYIYNKENSGKQKKINYKGCLSVRYYNYLLLREVMIIIEKFSVFLT